MKLARTNRLFITGTDTDVGKTFVGCLLAESLRYSGIRVGIYKPVASDCRTEGEEVVADDARKLWMAAGKPLTLADVCPQKFFAPLAPPQAARAEGKTVDRELLVAAAELWSEAADLLIIEGAGGLFSPLADGFLNIDLAKALQPADVLLVAANRLGCIHQTLATCEAARSRGIVPRGIVLCDAVPVLDPSAEQNAAEVARYSSVPVLGRVPYGATTADIESWVRAIA